MDENGSQGHTNSRGPGSLVPRYGLYLSKIQTCTLFEIAMLLLGIHSTEILAAVHRNEGTTWWIQHFGE